MLRDNFTMIPNDICVDKRLSWKAKGILIYLLGKPIGWIVQLDDICKQSSDGKASVRAGLQELRDLHYARVESVKEKGRFIRWDFYISDQPSLKPEDQATPESDFPQLDILQLENMTLSNTDRSKIEGNQERVPASPSDIACGSLKKESANDRRIKSESKHHNLIDLWGTEYEKFHGRKYTFTPRDFRAVKILVKNDSENEEIIRLARRGWASSDPYVRNPSVALYSFPDVINRISVESSRAKPNNHNI